MKVLIFLIAASCATVPLPAVQAASFAGYACTEDCSGHQAGYEWAAANGVTDPGYCDGNSQSFIEGCMAWAEEQSYYADDEDVEDENGDECEEECDE